MKTRYFFRDDNAAIGWWILLIIALIIGGWYWAKPDSVIPEYNFTQKLKGYIINWDKLPEGDTRYYSMLFHKEEYSGNSVFYFNENLLPVVKRNHENNTIINVIYALDTYWETVVGIEELQPCVTENNNTICKRIDV